MTKPENKPREVMLPDPNKSNEKKLCPVSGSKIDDFTDTLCRQTINTLWTSHSDSKQIDAQIQCALAAMLGVKPQDEVEGMLAAQMVATHNASMECFRRSMIPEQSFEGRKENLNQANKLTRSYATLVEALSRYRGKGQQKMTVEHVHVHAGGQAIVGNVANPEGGGAPTKTEEQPHAKQITHAPIETMSSQNTQREKVPVPSNA